MGNPHTAATPPLTSVPEHTADANVQEPLWALIVGAAAGAACFFFCALLFGAKIAVLIAVAATLTAVLRRERTAAIAFAVAGVLAAAGLLPSTMALCIAAVSFGVALALIARAVATTHAAAFPG